MSEAANELSTIRKYLLGGLDGEEREQLEERVLADAEFRDRVLLVEENLIEDYTEGALDEEERLSFQRMFSTNPQRRIEVQVVERLKQEAATKWWTRLLRWVRSKAGFANTARSRSATLASAEASRRDRSPGFRKAAIAFGLVIVVALAFLILQRFLRPEQTPPLLTEEQQRHDRIERELARLNSSQSREPMSSVAAATLIPGLSRGDETVEFPLVTVPRGTESTQLRLLLRPSGKAYDRFQVMLAPVDSRDSYKVELKPVELSPGVSALTLTLPLKTLDDGDYSVQLSGQTADGRTEPLPDHYYYFRLVRQ